MPTIFNKPILYTTRSLFVLVLLCASIIAAANEAPKTGDAEAGKNKSAVCAGCHGAQGNSAVPSFPNLAMQPTGYIAKQLADFKSGKRIDATMKGMVTNLSPQDMLDLDSFYAAQNPTVNEISTIELVLAKEGETIYRAGIEEFSVTACIACHGPDGKGLSPNFPRLSGQHSQYLEKQLIDFKAGTREDSMMNSLAFPLSLSQIHSLSVYLSSLN